jgi:DNA-binding NarL/FixJ family response regulator
MGIALKYSQAITMLENEKPDLILIDIILGGNKDGIDLSHEINLKYNIPFIFITSHADTNTVTRAKEVKPIGYLMKPFDVDDIYTTIEMSILKSSTKENSIHTILSKLSEREGEVYKVLLEGKTDQEIGDKLFISINTVKTHIKKIYEKLGVKTRLEAVSLINN